MRIIKTALIAALVVVVAGVGTAGASHLMTGKDIRDSSLTGRDIKNNSLSPADFTGSVKGTQGLQGIQGAIGAQGAQGFNQIARFTVQGQIAAGDVDSVSVSCPALWHVVSGTYVTIGALASTFYSDSFGSATTWYIGVDNY